MTNKFSLLIKLVLALGLFNAVPAVNAQEKITSDKMIRELTGLTNSGIKAIEPYTKTSTVPEVTTNVEADDNPLLKFPDSAFSSKGYISGHILKSIENSKKTIDVAVYGFTLTDVADALVKAKKRGVNVRVVANQSHVFSKPSDAYQKLKAAKINMRTLRGTADWGIMHNKIGIFDGHVVMTGSYNWTTAADQNNYENVVFRYDDEVVAGYSEYFEWMWNISRPLSAGGVYENIPVGQYGTPPQGKNTLTFNKKKFPKYVFSPLGGAEETVIKAIEASTKEIIVCMYSLFSQPIGDALINAINRGVKVKVVVDRLQAGSSPLTQFFMDNNVDFRWSKGYSGRGSMHHKYAIFDNKLLMTGSFNWSFSANTNNFENAFLSTRADDVREYKKEFDSIYHKAIVPTPADVTKKSMSVSSVDWEAMEYANFE